MQSKLSCELVRPGAAGTIAGPGARAMARAIARGGTSAIALALALACASLAGCDPGNDDGDGPDGQPQTEYLTTVRFPRLSHPQWENTVQDLLRLPEPPGLAASFDPDPPLGRFDNNADRLQMTGGLWQDYQRAAELMAQQVTDDAEALVRILPEGLDDLPEDDATARARAFIEGFGTRAYRRPLEAAEIARYEALFAAAPAHYDGLDAFTAGVRITIETMLQSPHFAYRSELSSEVQGDTIALSGYEIASRLSYAFWNTMPDDELFAAAAAGALDGPDAIEGIRAQALRMLDDERTRASFEHFHQQHFELHEYADIDKSPAVFPDWRREIGAMMQTETTRFLDSLVFDRDGTIGDILTSPHTFVNDELAALYGLEGDFSGEFVEVELDPTTRAGLLTRLGFLTRNATLSEPDPIHRGVFANLNVLCRSVNAVPNLPDNLMPVGETNRERIESITGKGTCAEACHGGIINPIGFSLEHYDAVGRYRSEDNGHPVDASSTYVFPDGRTLMFQDGVELSHQLAQEPEPHACYIASLVEYLYGNPIEAAELVLVGELTNMSLDQDSPIRELVIALVTSKSFRFRSPAELSTGQSAAQGDNP